MGDAEPSWAVIYRWGKDIYYCTDLLSTHFPLFWIEFSLVKLEFQRVVFIFLKLGMHYFNI